MNGNEDPHRTRNSLLTRLGASRDDLAWEVFLEYYQKFITVLLRRRGVPDDDIPDIRQEVCLICWRVFREGKFDPSIGRFRGWLARVTMNAANLQFRRNQRGQRNDDALRALAELELDEPVPDWVDEEWKTHVMRLAWQEAQMHFSDGVMRIYKRTLDGEDMAEIARSEGVAVNTVYVYRKRVEEALGGYIKQLEAYL